MGPRQWEAVGGPWGVGAAGPRGRALGVPVGDAGLLQAEGQARPCQEANRRSLDILMSQHDHFVKENIIKSQEFSGQDSYEKGKWVPLGVKNLSGKTGFMKQVRGPSSRCG